MCHNKLDALIVFENDFESILVALFHQMVLEIYPYLNGAKNKWLSLGDWSWIFFNVPMSQWIFSDCSNDPMDFFRIVSFDDIKHHEN